MFACSGDPRQRMGGGPLGVYNGRIVRPEAGRTELAVYVRLILRSPGVGLSGEKE